MSHSRLPVVHAPFSSKGGCFKTGCSHLALSAYDRAGIPVDAVEFDTVKALSKLHPRRVETHDVAADLLAVQRDPISAINFFGPLFARFAEPSKPQIIDLGAAMCAPFLAMARRARLGPKMPNGGSHLKLFVCTSTDLTDFEEALATWRTLRELFPRCQTAFVITERQGRSSLIRSLPQFKEIEKATGTRVVEIPRATSPLFSILYGNMRIALDKIVTLPADQIAKIPALDPYMVEIYLEDLRDWLRDVRHAFGDFLPSQTKNPA